MRARACPSSGVEVDRVSLKPRHRAPVSLIEDCAVVQRSVGYHAKLCLRAKKPLDHVCQQHDRVVFALR